MGVDRVSRLLERGTLRRWDRAAEEAGEIDLLTLEALRDRAQALRRRIDRLLHIADARLTLPRIGAAEVPRPLHTDWAARPPLWSGPVYPAGTAAIESGTRLGEDAALFHDCKLSELTFRQVRNTRTDDLAPFGVRLDVFRFDGSFLSLVLELPPEATDGLKKRHIVRQTVSVETEKPLEAFSRLNIRHGPNTEQIVRELSMNDTEMVVEFDLAYTDLNEKRIERAWVDLIFEGPEMNQITVRDVTFSRRPRAEL